MYVADASDGKVYTYNMPDALDARLASLSLTGVDIGEFDGNRTDYDGAAGEGVTETTVSAEALQRRTDVDIDPPDEDVAADGHQVALEGLTEITATVTSADGSRMKTYRVAFALPPQAIALTPTWTSFEWPGTDGIALADALRNGDLADTVIVVYHWDETTSTWLAFSPGLEDVPRPQLPCHPQPRSDLLGRRLRSGLLDHPSGPATPGRSPLTARPNPAEVLFG